MKNFKQVSKISISGFVASTFPATFLALNAFATGGIFSGGVQGGGDRRPRGSHALPRRASAPRFGLGHGLSQRAHGPAVELDCHGRGGDGPGGPLRDAE